MDHMTALRFAIVPFVFCRLAGAQLSGQFYMDKSTFAPGEPVFLHFQMTNNGSKAENVLEADPYSSCSGYDIAVSAGEKTKELSPNSSCAPPVIFVDCLSSDALLKPGQTRVENVLLNYEHDLGKPGDYQLEARRRLPHAPAGKDYFKAAKATLEISEKLYFRVDQDATADPVTLQRLVLQLRSSDVNERTEAALVLASIAPPALESTLLGFADSQEFRQFAPLAFHRLNTVRSMAAMAELLTKTQSGTYEHMKSADYLAESGDEQWFPLLREIAIEKPQISNYVDDAAELGGGEMIPTLVYLMQGPDKEFTSVNAVGGLGYTGSREAVPLLLDLLRNTDTGVADQARYALRLLTHHTADDQNKGPETEYPKWSNWWSRESSVAPIYKAKECGEITPLP
jgi:hypothetical protein